MGKVKKRSILLNSNHSQNVIRNLMLRDLGLHNINKTSTRELESIAETNLVLKSHRELVCISIQLCLSLCNMNVYIYISQKKYVVLTSFFLVIIFTMFY